MSPNQTLMDPIGQTDGGPKSMLNVKQRELVRSLYFDHHNSIKQICRVTAVSRNAARRCIRQNNPDQRLVPQTPATKFLQAHRAEVKSWLQECELHCPPLQRLLWERCQIAVPLRTLQLFCQSLRREIRLEGMQQDVSCRSEVKPGTQIQIDFGEKNVLLAGEVVRLHVFIAKLSYSRRIYAKAFLAETQEAWLNGLEAAFFYFGGIPKTVICDNATSLVRNHYAKNSADRFTERFGAFCSHYGIKPIATAVRHPRSKGKVESAVKFVKSNGMVAQDHSSLEEWNLWLENWCHQQDQRHLSQVFLGALTPAERFVLEGPMLQTIKVRRIAHLRTEERRVGADGLIRVDNRYYQLPHDLVYQEVQVQVDDWSITVIRPQGQSLTLDKVRDQFQPDYWKKSSKPAMPEAVVVVVNSPRGKRSAQSYDGLVGL